MGTTGLRILPALTAVGIAFGAVFAGCREEDPVKTLGSQGSTPTMVTVDVDTYVSDSGYIRYHAVTDIWEMYDDTAQPFWRFPKPLIIDILDPGMKPHAHIECDSARYLTVKQLFRFDSDVVAVNVLRDSFLTEQLYWDQKVHEFYTDSFIHIVKSDRILEGYGFRSNESMTQYTILKPTAILPVSAFRNGDENERRNSRDSVEKEQSQMYGDPLYRPVPVPASQRQQEAESHRLQPNSLNPTPLSRRP